MEPAQRQAPLIVILFIQNLVIAHAADCKFNVVSYVVNIYHLISVFVNIYGTVCKPETCKV